MEFESKKDNTDVDTDDMLSPGQVKVFCRFKPIASSEERSSSIQFYPEDSQVTAYRKHLFEKQTFAFDSVFAPDATQDDVFEACAKPLALSVIREKVNGCILAYGQTASGKTYTIEQGILPRIAKLIFSNLGPAEAITLSALEIFNEKMKDLLGSQPLTMRGASAIGLTQVRISSPEQASRIFRDIIAARATSETNMNDKSSRSHVIYSIRFLASGAVLHLADLAGSEKVSKTGATGVRLDEAKSINRSLLALGNVVNSLSTQHSSFVRFRDSKLTRVLQESLTGNSKTCLIVTCASDAGNEQETLSTLRFGQKAKLIVTKIFEPQPPQLVNPSGTEQLIAENNQLREIIEELEACRRMQAEKIKILEGRDDEKKLIDALKSRARLVEHSKIWAEGLQEVISAVFAKINMQLKPRIFPEPNLRTCFESAPWNRIKPS